MRAPAMRVRDETETVLPSALGLGRSISRRRFLKSSLGGLMLLGAGSLLPSGCRRYPTPSVQLHFLTSKEYLVMNQVAARLLGGGSGPGVGTEDVDVAAYVDRFIAGLDPDMQGQLRLLFRVFEHGTYLFDLRRRRFTRLDPEEQDRYLEGWMRSTLGARRLVFRGLKALAALGYYRDPRTWSALGYDGPWLGRVPADGRFEYEVPVSAAALRSWQADRGRGRT
jgi:hypothetical protein